MSSSTSLRVLVAPDSFKGTLNAKAVADAIAEGWRRLRPRDELILLPQADGGEGTLDAVERAIVHAKRRTTVVAGPAGATVEADWLLLADGTAVIELAQASGLALMPELDPLRASTRGVGELIAAALAAGATSLTIGLGGSASTDGGAGALSHLGLRLLDAHGADLPDGGGALEHLARIERTALVPAPVGGIRLLTDVTNPLLGSSGTAAVFGPQKGAGPEDQERLERGLTRFAQLLGGDSRMPGGGAAGGTAYGLAAAWGAEIVPGAHEIAGLTGMNSELLGADVLITGEGRFDATSLGGKVVGTTLARSTPKVASFVIAGSVEAEIPQASFVSLVAIAGSRNDAMAMPRHWITEAGMRIAATVDDIQNRADAATRRTVTQPSTP